MMRSTILLLLALTVSAFGQAFPGSAAYQAAFLKPAASSTYNPSNDTAGMIVWFNPDTQTENDGDSIVQIHDRSGNAKHLTQTESALRRATLQTSEINGKATFRTDTASGMYHDSFAMPGDVTVFWATSNSVTRTVFNHDDYWVGNLFQNNVLLDYNEMIVGQRLPDVWGVFSMDQDGTGRIFRQNGWPISGWKSTESDGSGRLMLFAGQAYNFNFATDFGEFLIYSNSTMTVQRRQNIEQYLCTKYARSFGTAIDSKIRVYCDGDSITFGDGSNTEAGGEDSWPARLRAGIGSNYDVVNIAVSGQNLLSISNDAPYQVFPFHGGGTNVLFMWEYINSTGMGGSNEIANAISNYCIGAISAGWPTNRIVVASDFHSSTTNAGNVVQRFYTNYAGHFIDLNLQSLRDDSAGIDNIHLSATGWQIVANAVSNVIKNAIYP
jgi:lysophospholipase L1-like esterase